MAKYKIVHYLNQFFAGIGGEEMADYKPELREGVVGPGGALAAALGPDYEIVATVICGDNYFGENLDEATDTIIEMVKKYEPNVFVAGPAFNAGRYGVACGTICKAVEERLGIPVLTAEYEENPGTDMFRKDVIIVKTGNSSADMKNAIPTMAKLIKKMATGEEILGPAVEGYHERGIRVNYFAEKRGSERGLEMLIKKMKGEPFETDLPMPKFDRSNATKFGEYSIAGKDSMSPDEFTTIHGGYDRQFVMANPNLVVPLDVLRELEKAGEFGKLYDSFFTTTGTGTATGSAAKFGDAIGKKLKEDGVDGVILVST